MLTIPCDGNNKNPGFPGKADGPPATGAWTGPQIQPAAFPDLLSPPPLAAYTHARQAATPAHRFLAVRFPP